MSNIEIDLLKGISPIESKQELVIYEKEKKLPHRALILDKGVDPKVPNKGVLTYLGDIGNYSTYNFSKKNIGNWYLLHSVNMDIVCGATCINSTPSSSIYALGDIAILKSTVDYSAYICREGSIVKTTQFELALVGILPNIVKQTVCPNIPDVDQSLLISISELKI